MPTMIPYKQVTIVDHPLQPLVDGRRVAVIGSAESLIGTGDGHKIDSYDVVIRCNLERPIQEEHYKWVGSRTDVIYHNVDNYNKFVRDGRYMGIQSVGQFKPYPFSGEVATKYHYLKNDGRGWCPMSGLVCIFTTCICGATEVYCSGFDFYRSGNRNGAKMIGDGQTECHIDCGSYNNVIKDELAFRKMVTEFPITTDAVLTRILNEPARV